MSMRRRVFIPSDEERMTDRGDQDDRTVRRLASRVGELEAEVRLLGKIPSNVEESTSDDTAPVQRDARWHCSKCGYLLAFYDVDLDVLRTRYKEHIVYMRAGIGGFVQIVCRGCSEVNTQEYTDPNAAVDESAD